MSAGSYPAGASTDRSAPFNCPGEVECPLCDGKGEIEVGHLEYLEPTTYDPFHFSEWVVDYTKKCTLCLGNKTVDQDTADEFNYDPDEKRDA